MALGDFLFLVPAVVLGVRAVVFAAVALVLGEGVLGPSHLLAKELLLWSHEAKANDFGEFNIVVGLVCLASLTLEPPSLVAAVKAVYSIRYQVTVKALSENLPNEHVRLAVRVIFASDGCEKGDRYGEFLLQLAEECLQLNDGAHSERNSHLVREDDDAEAVSVEAAYFRGHALNQDFPLKVVCVEAHLRLNLDESLVEVEGGDLWIYVFHRVYIDPANEESGALFKVGLRYAHLWGFDLREESFVENLTTIATFASRLPLGAPFSTSCWIQG